MPGNQAIYDGLRDYLCRHPAHTLTLTFRKIESMLGTLLPKSARTNKAWWSNRRSSLQGSAWLSADSRVIAVDLVRQQVTFRKAVVSKLQRWFGNPVWDRDQIRSLRRHMKLNQTDFALRVNVCRQMISRWETGRTAPGYFLRLHFTSVARKSRFLLS